MTDQIGGTSAVGTTPNESAVRRYPVEFHGKGFEYFKIWIVNILLTIITLFIYSAWAKVRNKRYFYGNTVIDNSSFEYHAKPLQILLGRVIAIVVFAFFSLSQYLDPIIFIGVLILVALLLPWAIWRSLKFNARMSSYRNVRFGFVGTAKRSYMILLIIPILLFAAAAAFIYLASTLNSGFLMGIATAGVLILAYSFYPIFHQMMAFYSHNYHRYGTAMFSAPLTKRSFIWIYVKTVLLALLVFGTLAVLARFLLLSTLETGMLGNPEYLEEVFKEGTFGPLQIAFAIVGYLLFFLLGAVLTAFFQSRLRNYRYNLTAIDNRVEFESTVRMRSLTFLLVTNLLILIFTLGLGYPWAKVRSARYYAKHTQIISAGPLDQFVAAEEEKVSALGDELGEAFDLDLDIGI